MSESSVLWSTSGVGDGTNSGYTQAQMHEMFRALFAGIHATNLGGVVPDYLNELAVTGTATPVAVNTGAAVVYGLFYSNSASVNVAVSTPSVSTRIDYIVLRASYAAQTIRITKIDGAEGGAAPALTQSAGTTWDIPLATVSITTGGVITVTDAREWASLLGDGMVTLSKMAANSVDSDQYVDGSIDLIHMSANSVDSDQYVDGSIDTVHIADAQVTQAKLGTDTLQMMCIPLCATQIAHTGATSPADVLGVTVGQADAYLDADKLPTGATVKLAARLTKTGDTCTYSLRNFTDSSDVTSSGIVASSTDANGVWQVSSDFKANLASGAKTYRMRVLHSTGGLTSAVFGAYLLVEW